MSISATLSNALSGLTAMQRSAETVSTNIANATTEGYGRRAVDLSSAVLGGVRIDGIRRETDEALIGDRRLADAGVGYSAQQTAFYQKLEETVGIPGTAGALGTQIAALETALAQAASTPSSDIRLGDVLTASQDLAGAFNRISDGIQDQRMAAETRIETEIGNLNQSLQRIADLNGQIRTQVASGRDASGLMDARQQQIDQIAQLVPIQTHQRDNGQVAIFTTTGAQLVDATAATFGFAGAGLIVPEMTLQSGALSGLTLNGQPIATQGAHAPIAGGGLQALLDTRDNWAVTAQAELDAVARDLVERFQGVGTALGNPGLFTDNGAVFATTDEVGLAARIAVNPVVDPDQGGATWRLRDGLDAAAPGLTGNSSVLNAFAQALSTPRTPASGQFSARAYSASDLAGALVSDIGAARQSAEADQSFATARHQSLYTAELGTGVDTDQELQRLLLIEQSYAANARVIQTADEMIETLLRL
ncbi:flagellar hook-associated protein FlgK [Actibacterium ureilyticum]|uniref:flagellar hook-associated protein FlgK n=1 Tax=Actibacterium ureilyticum TaxID=1590614 RepID=UPI000BAAB3B7|nr:flagellar hook-associated protein FlgK [Actibacterium ureilyticum]